MSDRFSPDKQSVGKGRRHFAPGLATPRIAILAGLLISTCAPLVLDAIDSNNNGISDVWEQLYSVPANAGNDDNDADGFTNLQESLLGTNPEFIVLC